MLLGTVKNNWLMVVVSVITLWISNVGYAHNKVVVVPLLGDNNARVFAPMKTDEAPRADYFIHSETVRDLVTGLEWQRNESTFSHSWEDAREICNDLTLRGFDDWRLPIISELIGITDYTSLSPAISVQAFPNPKTALDYWSSTFDPYFPGRIRTLDLSDGQVNNSVSDSTHYVRCVRAGFSSGSTFIDNNDGTVLDLSFGLMWEKTPFSGNFDVSAAITYCQELSLGGYSDWRMPSVKESITLLDFRADPEINPIFSLNNGLGPVVTSALLGNDEVWRVRLRRILQDTSLVYPTTNDEGATQYKTAMCVRDVS